MRSLPNRFACWLALAAGLLLMAGCTASGVINVSTSPTGSTDAAATAGPVTKAGEGFAIYLTADGLSVSEMADASLEQVRLGDSPFISPVDILTYDEAGHEIELTPEARLRLADFNVPTTGVPFVACVDGLPIYWGAFWTPLSSASFPGVVIQKPMGGSATALRVELGYPSPQFFRGEDPRPAPEVLEALDRAGKLR